MCFLIKYVGGTYVFYQKSVIINTEICRDSTERERIKTYLAIYFLLNLYCLWALFVTTGCFKLFNLLNQFPDDILRLPDLLDGFKEDFFLFLIFHI